MPVLLDSRQIAKLLSSDGDEWSSRKARRFMIKTGIGRKVGGRWCTTACRIAEAFPEIYRELMLADYDGEP